MTDMRRTVALLVSATATLLGGCASTMNGLGGEGSYACKAPVGSQCTSVSGVYANSIHGQPPASALPKPAKGPASTAPVATTASASTAAPGLGAPQAALRSQPRVLRLWIAPWEDADGDLHEASVVHVLVDTGRWLIERVLPANRQRVDAVRPPVPSTAPASGAASASETVPSTEAGPDRFPPRTGLLPGNGASQEP
ncbi:MAG TPA: type IV conjugative transfer system lipoprotein TraV [Burkholderiaceae bacterium]|nr:type IV conjugative transfer system lipoprotein TraV [Burkholderiaceae bacterium]HPE02821.1 type IV conjugative transfer system lipoprotein TraV [Burkholderiaceae bacterium]